MARRCSIPMPVLAAAVIAAAFAGRLASADSTMDCINRMVPCYQYLNSTAKPPASCCNPLKAQEAATIACLCNLYNTPGMLEKYNINVTQVLRVGQGCGVNATTSVCKESAAQSPTSPGVAGSSGHNGGNRAWTGISWFLLSIWASVMLY
ncbi:non-specific lipid transfer protein GPI-anchored 7 [Syzygium oleosum]|uniref:non-specific lipid transfer protein GPI-anchored 7 n=1 Tax=Syzygium oleosum TaxID=219896 RepID=UPI0011D21CFC|nr:non-specific lipid transfer protein GPI-anchored 7 [Syzygium oleosum]